MEKWSFYTSNEIKPDGWIKRQLEIQAAGLSGNLDKVWRDIRDAAWIGGDADGWERVPYWLDGFIPLAYLLEDDELIARGKKYIDAIIEHQKPDGWICPCAEEDIPNYDTWAVQLISKTLLVYYECSGDERIPDVIYKLLRNYYNLLSSEKIKLFSWAEYRWYETFIAIDFLKERYGEKWIDDLAVILKNQGYDYRKAVCHWKTPFAKTRWDTHIVNIAMMLKYEAVSYEILGEEYTDRAEYFHNILKNYNGTPVGLFTGDEHLAGLSPIHGTELCAVVEQMYSYERLFANTGDKKWLERLELLAFNALPATISDDMWTHQYDQLSNQIACKKFPGKPIFGTNGADSHLFGLEPNYGCCTANFSQGWPKFVLSSFMHKGNTVLSSVLLPASLSTDDFTIISETDYPFENSVKYKICAENAFTFKVRIPSFAESLTVDGQKIPVCEYLIFNIADGENREISISFTASPKLTDRPHDLKTVTYGSLVFSLPITFNKEIHEYTENGVERKFPYCDYEYTPVSDWNYAFSDVEFEVTHHKVGEIPFSSESPAITVNAKMKKIPWGLEHGYETVCAKTPESCIPLSGEETKALYPYGCAKLRMTEIPLTD